MDLERRYNLTQWSTTVRCLGPGFASRRLWWISAAPYVAFSSIVLSQYDFVPLWDAWAYAECAARAARAPIELHNYACAGHLSHAYIFLLSIPSWWTNGQHMWHLLVVNAVLGCLAIHSAMSIARAMLPARAFELDVLLLGLLIALHPQLLSSAVFINVDFGIYAFAMTTLAALLRRHYGRASVAGCLLAFSKEPGVVVYGILVACVLTMHAYFACGLKRVLHDQGRRLLLLSLPLLIVLGFYSLFPDERPAWSRLATPEQWLTQFTSLRSSVHRDQALWSGLLLMQFGWLMTATMAAALAVWGSRFACAHVDTPTSTAGRRARVTVIVATLMSAYVLTRPQTYVNTRYYALIYALISLLFVVAAVRLCKWTPWRRVVLAGSVALLGASAFRTVDPVSKYHYGTFEFGRHEMLRMTSISHECCGSGIDQLAYNLEIVNFHRLLDAATRSFKPDPQRPIVVADGLSANFAACLDSRNSSRLMPCQRSVPSMVVDLFGWRRVLQPRPKALLFLAMPNADNRGALTELLRWYPEARVQRYEYQGYALSGYWLVR